MDDIIPEGPKPIVQLSTEVINRIAAAEIIHRPSNAIKELIENSLDAGSTSIKVTLKEGGLKSFQVTDNGSGIDVSSLPLLCTRYATSKLSTFDDLQSLSTYGFRGEALASISFCCGKVTVITKRKSDNAGWKAFYQDGELVDSLSQKSSQGGQVSPKPSASNPGTTILAEDLFYNNLLRRKSFKSPNEEHNRILDIVSRYAVHNPSVGWSLKKVGSGMNEISTPQGGTTLGNIGLLYGVGLSKELLYFGRNTMKSGGAKDDKGKGKQREDDMEVDELEENGEEQSGSLDGSDRDMFNEELAIVNLEGWVSNANWNQKRLMFLLFINHRLVESSKIRKAVEGLYASYLPKGTSPFVYLSLEIDPKQIDVNVHPTKQEVHFMNEEQVIEVIVEEISKTLSKANASRSYTIQTLLPGARDPKVAREERIFDGVGGKGAPSTQPQSSAPQHKVRLNPQDRTLESMQMFAVQNPSQLPDPGSEPPSKRRRLMSGSGSQAQSGTPTNSSARRSIRGGEEEEPIDVDAEESDQEEESHDHDHGNEAEEEEEEDGFEVQEEEDVVPSIGRRVVEESDVTLKSVKKLRADVAKSGHKDLTKIIREHTFVGFVDMTEATALIQHQTKLYMIHYAAFSDQLFYQLGLRQFGAFGKIKLNPPPSVQELVKIAVDNATPEITKIGKHDPEMVVNRVTTILYQQRAMLNEYFMFEITDEGNLAGIPMLLPDYTPDLNRLPHFLLCLGVQVNWNDEVACFEDFLRELAFYYSPRNVLRPLAKSKSKTTTTTAEGDKEDADGESGMEVDSNGEEDDLDITEEEIKHEEYQVRHVLLPAMKKYGLFSKELLSNGEIRQLANLPELYKIFERC